ncbi:MAG TPA: cysteine-rich CWC family protein [Burkholderiaceae bacterium]|nr:cysteine-rich CWC family protein [Burkholderiaceae bacterium]
MSVCARCGATFTCAMADGDGSEPCWCASLPLVMPVPSADVLPPAADPSCWCPDCLRRHIATTSAAAAPSRPE